MKREINKDGLAVYVSDNGESFKYAFNAMQADKKFAPYQIRTTILESPAVFTAFLVGGNNKVLVNKKLLLAFLLVQPNEDSFTEPSSVPKDWSIENRVMVQPITMEIKEGARVETMIDDSYNLWVRLYPIYMLHKPNMDDVKRNMANIKVDKKNLIF